MFLGEKNTGLIGKFNHERSFILQDSRTGDSPFDSISKFWRQNSPMHANILVAYMASSYLQLTSFYCGTIPVLGL